mgnify:CR=1 FL=1
MARELTIDATRLHRALQGGDGLPGVFEQALGFRVSTKAIKGVHLMNDLAQCVLGGAPEHRGDLLCRVIREAHTREPNSDRDLRQDDALGVHYRRAYPEQLGRQQVTQLREAARLLLNADSGMYKPGDNMASSLATHRDLLGWEGFRRFRVGRYVQRVLGHAGRERVREMFESADDPVSRAMKPLMVTTPLIERYPDEPAPPLTAFDDALGRRLTILLSHPLTKPNLLRGLSLAGNLGVVLKILGAGRPGGHPVLLALPDHTWVGVRKPAREEAVQSFQLGIDAADRAFARHLARHPLGDSLWAPPADDDTPTITVTTCEDERDNDALMKAARAFEFSKKDGTKDLYWPDEFAIALGKRAGCVGPRRDQAGWSKHLMLTPELVELLVLMFVPPGARPLPWRALWETVRDELGIVIGANSHADDEALKGAGVLHIDLGQLARSSDVFLAQAICRGVARRLPDSGAEAGGELL